MLPTGSCAIRLLGSFDVHIGSQTPMFRRKTRAVLAYLAATDRAHRRQALSDMFCQEAKDPSGALRWYLSRIRRQLGAEILLVEGDTVRFDHRAGWVDCVTFQRVLEQGPADQDLETLLGVVELYRGKFLAGVALSDAPEFELWLLGQRAHLSALYERGLFALVAQLVALERHTEAIPWTQKLVQTNPLLEEAHARLVWLYAKTGRRQAALQQYDRCCALLNGEDFRRVPEWAPRAAERDQQLYVYADALAAYEAACKALDYVWDEMPPDAAARKKAELLLGRIKVLSHLGRRSEEAALLQMATDALSQQPDARSQAAFHLCQVYYLSAIGEYRDAYEAALRACESYLQLGDQRRAAEALREAGVIKLIVGQVRTGRRLLNEALALYRVSGNVLGESRCISMLAFCALSLGEIEVALEHLARALEIAEQRGDKPGRAFAGYVTAQALDHTSKAIERLEELSGQVWVFEMQVLLTSRLNARIISAWQSGQILSPPGL